MLVITKPEKHAYVGGCSCGRLTPIDRRCGLLRRPCHRDAARVSCPGCRDVRALCRAVIPGVAIRRQLILYSRELERRSCAAVGHGILILAALTLKLLIMVIRCGCHAVAGRRRGLTDRSGGLHSGLR